MAAKGNSCFWLANVKKIFSETAWPNGAKLDRKHLCKILYKTSSFGSIRPTNMTAVTKNRTYVKLHVFGNNSKTVNNIRNLTGIKMISTARSNYPEILNINGFWVITKNVQFYICSIFSNSGHVCWPNGTKWRSFIEDLT
jgi:hypothetical protein